MTGPTCIDILYISHAERDIRRDARETARYLFPYCRIAPAATYNKALFLLAHRPAPDLIFTDFLYMPDRDARDIGGGDFLCRLRGAGIPSPVIVIADEDGLPANDERADIPVALQEAARRQGLGQPPAGVDVFEARPGLALPQAIWWSLGAVYRGPLASARPHPQRLPGGPSRG